MATKTSFTTWFVLGLIALGVGQCAVNQHNENRREAEADERRAQMTPEQRKAQRERVARDREIKAREAAEKAEHDAMVNRAAIGARVLKKSALDPERFKLESALVIDGSGAVCYTYRAANMYGGVVPGQAVLASKTDRFLTDAEPGFVTMWNAECGGRTGSEVATAIRWFAL